MGIFEFILEAVYFCAVQFFGMASGLAGLIGIFTAGYTYANVVKYRAEHEGQLDFIEVLRQMSSKTKKDDEDEDMQVEYLLSQEQDEDIEIIGDDTELAELI